MERPETEKPRARLPLTLHALRLAATMAVSSAFRWKRPTKGRLFRGLMARAFGRLAPRYDELSGRLPGGSKTYTTPLREALSDPLTGPAPKRFLDQACGTAQASRLVAERFPESEAFGLDLALPMLFEARGLWASRPKALHLTAGDAASPPFKPGSFDLVVVMNAPPEPEAVLRLLAPGGRAVFAYSLPYTPMVRDHIRRRLKEAGLALSTVRPSGLGTLVIARREE